MFAIIITGVCLAMLAGAFPAALKMNQSSFATVMGNMITENGLAIAEMKLTHPLPTGGQLTDVTSRLGDTDHYYPTGDDSRRGFRILARRMSAGNDYLLVLVAYEKTESSNQVKTLHLSETVDADSTTFSAGDEGDKFQPNGVVVADTGQWAAVESVDGNTVKLDRPLNTQDSVTGLTVIYETNSSGNALVVMNPGTRVLSVRTSLRGAP